MAEGYTMSKTLGYYTEYMQRLMVLDIESRMTRRTTRMNDEIIQGNGWAQLLSHKLYIWAHYFIIHNSSDLVEWRR